MKKLHLLGMKRKNIATSIGIGLLVAIAVTGALAIALTSFVQSERLRENGMVGVFLIRIIAMVAGGLIGVGFSDNKILPVLGGIAVGYLVILLALGIILLDGTVCKPWLGVLSTAAGAVIAMIIKLKSQTTRKKPVRYAK